MATEVGNPQEYPCQECGALSMQFCIGIAPCAGRPIRPESEIPDNWQVVRDAIKAEADAEEHEIMERYHALREQGLPTCQALVSLGVSSTYISKHTRPIGRIGEEIKHGWNPRHIVRKYVDEFQEG